MKAHIILFANPTFQLQILGDTTKNVKLNGIPENNFLCIFIIYSLIPRGAYFLLSLENKQEATSEVKVNQLKVKNMHFKISISAFRYRFDV